MIPMEATFHYADVVRGKTADGQIDTGGLRPRRCSLPGGLSCRERSGIEKHCAWLPFLKKSQMVTPWRYPPPARYSET